MKARLFAASLALCFAPGIVQAQPASSVVAVVHVDIAPAIAPGTPDAQANKMRGEADALGRQLVLEWASYCKREQGCQKIDALQQVGSLNHFTLVETFDSLDAQGKFDSLPAVRELREHIQPVLGGPLDARYSNKIN